MSLFRWGNFTLHSGGTSWWGIDCDDMTEAEVALFAPSELPTPRTATPAAPLTYWPNT